MNNDDNAADEDGCNGPSYYPVLSEIADATSRARTLSTFAELCFIAGLAGDETDDWRADMRGAVAKAFASIRPPRRDEIERLLTAAYYAGCDHATIIAAPRPEHAMRFAAAKATLHELRFGEERHAPTSAHELEARATAYLLAHKLPINADEAAACSIYAMRDAGFEVPQREWGFVLEGASQGLLERETYEAAGREYRERQASFFGTILGEGADA